MNYFESELEVREHHCLGDEIPIMSGQTPNGIGDNPANAWIPQGTAFTERNVSVLYPDSRIMADLKFLHSVPEFLTGHT